MKKLVRLIGVYITFFLLFFKGEVLALNIELNKEKVLSGTTLAVLVTKQEQEIEKIDGAFLDKPVYFFPGENGKYYCLKGISIYAKEGKYPFLVDVQYKNGEEEIIGRAVGIEGKKEGQKEEIKISNEKIKKITDKNLSEENQKISRFLTSVTEKRMWWKNFSLPATGIISSSYDSYRSINNGARKFFHQGLDIACQEGSPVKASNCGEVVFTGELISRGNTVIINHGQGVFTVYCHLSKIEVKENDFLKKDDLIGFVGNTGMSSGPHLHWSFYLHELPVDPQEWIEGKIDTFIFGRDSESNAE